MALLNEYLIDHPQFKCDGVILVDIPTYREKSPRGLEKVFVSNKKTPIKIQTICEIESTKLVYLIKTKEKEKMSPNMYLKKMKLHHNKSEKIFKGKLSANFDYNYFLQIIFAELVKGSLRPPCWTNFTHPKNKVTKPLMLILQR